MKLDDTTTTDDILGAEGTLSVIEGSTQEIIAQISRCPACGSRLHFKHITDFGKNTTREISKCPECQYRAKELLHRLQ